MRPLRRRSPSVARLLVIAGFGLVAHSAAAQRIEGEFQLAQADTGTTAGEERRGADVSDELEAAGSSIEPPAGAEVFRVKGRAVTAIETEVPTSATQFDAREIEALGAQSVSDLAKVTPNVNITTTGATTPTFFIRGVGLSDFNSNAAGAVAIYQDDVAINAPAIQLGQLYDVADVQILRGPQGDGAGRNASGGAIKVYSRKPTGNREANLRVDYGNYSSVDVEGALEAPITQDSLSARLAFRYSSRDGYVTNGCGGLPPISQRPAGLSYCGENTGFGPSRIPAGLPDRVNDRNRWAARGTLRYQPPETEMDFVVGIHGGVIDSLSNLGQAVGTQGEGLYGLGGTSKGYIEPDIQKIFVAVNSELGNSVPLNVQKRLVGPPVAEFGDGNVHRGDFDRVGDTILNSWGGYVRAELPLSDAKLTSISGYEWYDRFRDTDTDNTPDVLFEILRKDGAWQFSQDIRLTGEMDNTPLKWNTGFFYLMQELESDSDFLLAAESQNANQLYSEKLWSYGVYAGFDWEFLDDFTLHAGARYNWEKKAFQVTLSGLDGNVRRAFPERDRTWSAPTGTISLTYRFTDTLNAYWKYSRGWKGGHFNAASAAGRETFPAEPETIDAFELGMAGRWLENRVILSWSFFHYAYQDYQVFIVRDSLGNFPQLQVINANDAEVFGLEADLRVEPIDRLIVTGRFGWLQSTFLDFTDTKITQTLVSFVPPVVTQTQRTDDFSGNRLISSPQFKFSMSAEYTVELGRFGALIPRYDGAWSDDIYFDASEGRGTLNGSGEVELPEYAIGQPAFWLHNLRLTYRTPEGNMELAAWVRNVTDQAYKAYAFDASMFSGVAINFPGEPRTFGGSIAFSW